MRQERSGSPPWTCGELKWKKKSARKWRLRSSSKNGGISRSPQVKGRKEHPRRTEHPSMASPRVNVSYNGCKRFTDFERWSRESGVGGRTWICKDIFAVTDGSRRPAANLEFKFAIAVECHQQQSTKYTTLMDVICFICTDSISRERNPGGPVQSAELRRL